MENKTKQSKLIVLMCFLVLFSGLTAMNSIYREREMKVKLKQVYSVIIKEQVKDSLPNDTIRNSIKQFRDIDSVGFSQRVKIMDFIIKDYKRVSLTHDSLLKQ